MTQQSPDTALEQRLEESFASAHDDPRWAGDGWTDPVSRLHRAGRRQRHRIAVASALSVAALAGGVAAAVSAIPTSNDRVGIAAPLAGGQSGSGLDWLLPLDQYQAYERATPVPSPGWTRVPSPAPLDDEVAGLEADLRAALPPGVEVLRRDAANGGAKGNAVIELRLADGTPLVAVRKKLEYPVALAAYTGVGTPDPGVAYEHFEDPQTWPDATAYSVISGTSWGYSLPASEGGDDWSGPYVDMATPDGWLTELSAPVSPSTLLSWAQAVDAHFVGD